MIPQPWSFSRLDAYENCPRQFYETSVAKNIKTETSKEMQWGRDVHKHFENHLLYGTALPADLTTHGEFLGRVKAMPGELAGEERIALGHDLKESTYFGKSVWYRGQVDARVRNVAHGFSYILDHKTGKHKSDFRQLKTFAIHEFLTQPDIHIVRAEYYWTQIKGTNGETYRRDQLWDLFREFAPALTRYSQAFITNTWTPKQSGLCNGWCPVTTCEFWRPKRRR